jgi:hypothetical protein
MRRWLRRWLGVDVVEYDFDRLARRVEKVNDKVEELLTWRYRAFPETGLEAAEAAGRELRERIARGAGEACPNCGVALESFNLVCDACYQRAIDSLPRPTADALFRRPS